jgi:hypothetical protein
MVIGVIASVSEKGIPFVTLPGVAKPVAARTAMQIPSGRDSSEFVGREVLVHVPDKGTPPVIGGFVADSIFAAEQREGAGAPNVAVVHSIDGKKISLVAQEEITLQCGQSMIILRRDGTVIVKGVNVTSRASRRQKVQGPTVSIN